MRVLTLKQQLSNVQFTFLMIWIVMASGVIFLPYLMAHFVTRDSWISASLFVVSALVLYATTWLFVRACPNQTLVEGLMQGFGRWFGRGFAMVFLVLVFLACVTMLRKSTLFLEESVLPATPLAVIDLCIIVPVGYAAYMGVEGLGRLSDVVTPAAILITLLICALSLKNVHPSYLLPILATGYHPVLKGALVPWGFAMQALFCLQFVHTLRNPKRQLPRSFLWAGLIVAAMGVLAHLLMVSVLGEQMAYLKYPLLEVVKSIRYGDFFQRLDPLYVGGVLLGLMLQQSLMLHVIASSAAEAFGVSDYRNLVWPTVVALAGCSVLFWGDGERLDEFIVYSSPGLALLALLGLPLLAIGAAWFRRKGRHATSQ